MEPYQRKAAAFELSLFCVDVDTFLRKLCPSTVKVGLNISRSLVGNLNTALHQRLRHILPVGKCRRLGGNEKAEIIMRFIAHGLEQPFQCWHPSLHQVTVLKHCPAAFSGKAFGHRLCWLLLSLAHGNIDKLAVFKCESECF